MPIIVTPSTPVSPGNYNYTAQQVLDRARVPLNDSAKVRNPDTELLAYLNDAILRIRYKRPDLFVGRFTALPAALAVTDTLPLRDEFVPILADYVTFMAEAKDDEFVDNSRAIAFLNSFDKAVTHG